MVIVYYATIEARGWTIVYAEIIRKRLVEERKKAGYTQRDIADKIKEPPSKIAKIETGFQSPDAETIGKLAEFYNVSTDWLFGLGQKRQEKHYS